MDMLPFPRMMGNSPEEKIADIINYLIQFKETLEFALTNISTDNLSPDLINKLNELGADVKKNNETMESELSQIAFKTLSIYEVCASELLKSTIVDELEKNLKISVNYETGHLEYTTRKEGV